MSAADFFVSYTSADKKWAEWVAYILEEAGYRVIIQAWDFVPGANFVLEMQKATSQAKRTIAILSPDYLKSTFASPEWAAAFASDPEGLERKLVPIKIRDCVPDGLLKSLVHVDLTNLDEPAARQELVSKLKVGRLKPTSKPSFPGTIQKSFPGTSTTGQSQPYLPKVKREYSDLEKNRFLDAAFKTIEHYFSNGLNELKRQHEDVDFNHGAKGSSEFSSEIYVSGKARCRCRIWRGGVFGETTISYAEGRHMGDNSCNDSLHVTIRDGELFLYSSMHMGFGLRQTPHINPEKLPPEIAAEYLWRRFVSPLEN